MPDILMEMVDIKSRGSVISLWYSDKPNLPKKFAEMVRLEKSDGIEDDDSAKVWHQQVEILSWQTVTKLMEKDYHYEFGECGKNLCITSADLSSLKTGDFLYIGKAVLVVTRKGRGCRNRCKLGYFHPEDCPASMEWVFANVIQDGPVCADDEFLVMGV